MEDEDLETPESQSGTAMADLRKALRERDKALSAATEAAQKAQAALREYAVKDAVRDLGLNPKVAKLVPDSVAPENLAQWLEDYKDVFGSQPSTQEQQTQASQSPPSLDPVQVEAWARMQGSQSGQPSTLDVEQQQLAQLAAYRDAANGSVDRYIAFLRGEAKLPTT